MTTSLRSKAEFLRKLKDFDLSDHAKLFTEGGPTGLGIFTMQRMAQACGANHDHVKQEQITALIEDPLIAKGLPELSRFDARALYWECVYASVQENRHRFSIHKDEFLLPFNERERSERRVALKGELNLVLPHAFTGLLDPAHCTEDDFHDFLMADRLLFYVGPLDCPTRAEERKVVVPRSRRTKPVAGVSDDLFRAFQAMCAPERPTIAVDISTHHLLDHAFMRRGMTLHTVGLMPWASHELWRQTLMGSLYLEPLRAGFAPPDVVDVLTADKAIWQYLEKACPDRIRPDPGAPGHPTLAYPLVRAMEDALKEPEVKAYLVCQPKHLKGSSKAPGPTKVNQPGAKAGGSTAGDAKKVKKKDKKAKAKAKANANADRLAKLEKQVAKGKGKGREPPPPQAVGERRAKVPKALLPKGQAKTADGTSLCFGFNLGTCTSTDVQPGQKCPKGLHKCCFEGCYAAHPMKGNH